MANTLIGYTDEAAERDLFRIKDYVNGMAEFIRDCKTPMTISIQGSWGTGKTSIMKMIDKQINNDIVTMWFNSWQYSQFNMGNDLSLSFLNRLIKELSVEEDKSKEIFRQTLNIIKWGAKTVGLTALGRFDSKIASAVEAKIDETGDMPEAINNLKEQFENVVQKKLKAENADRVVIFVDDLDRLAPVKAVELLEILKLFLDCKGCIFILAIDYDVVVQGVEQKYGKIVTSENEHDKGRSFFDKIIQVPFKLPVARYDITNYVKRCFKDLGINCSNKELATYVEMIRLSIGTNPRTMKRLFNSYLLLTKIVPDEILEKTQSKRILFASLCLQYYWDVLYNYIIKNRNIINQDTLLILAGGTKEQIRQTCPDLVITDEDIDEIQPFIKVFVASIDLDDSDSINEEELNNFRNVIGFSTLTSAAENDYEG